jgi:TfoX/Sxy family transcriptional regulator of competence genes
MRRRRRTTVDKIPKSTKEAEAFLRSLLPRRADVTVGPMFGNLSALVNGNVYAGFFADELFVRLPEGERDGLLRARGASYFEPMRGRPMKGYVVVPKAWMGDPARVMPWMSIALEWTSKLPAKGKEQVGRCSTPCGT